jgi:hypothetical protein
MPRKVSAFAPSAVQLFSGTILPGLTFMLKRPTVFALLVFSGCLPATERDFEMAQTITEMTAAVNEIRQLSYELQDRVDSLTTVVAKRDAVIRQLANLAGVPIPP